MAYEQLPYSDTIAAQVEQGIMQGLTVKDIFAGIQGLKDAPASYTTFYRKYGHVMAAARNRVNGEIGGLVIDQARAGDFKSQELFLKSRADWNPSQKIQVEDVDSDEEETQSAVDRMAELLGFTGEDDEEDH